MGTPHRFMSWGHGHEFTGCFQLVDGHAARTVGIVVLTPDSCGRLVHSIDKERPDGHRTATAADEPKMCIAVRVIMDLKPASLSRQGETHRVVHRGQGRE